MRHQVDDKRQKILSAALTLFQHTHDVKKVSIEDIAREAHVSPTTIYNQFGTRESLVGEVAKLLIRKIINMSEAYIRSDLPFPRKLSEIIAGKMDIVSQVDKEILLKVVKQDRDMAPFIEEIYRTEIRPLWSKFIKDGKKQGYIDLSLDEAALLLYLDVLRTGFASKPELTRDWEKNIPLIEQLTRLMFYGFLQKDIDLFRKEMK